MEYFGTSLTEYGHYRWLLNNGLQYQGLKLKDLPFNPEGLTNNLPKGETIFYQGGGYTVIGISGSCKDTRPGTKSIFWVEAIITRDAMKQCILDNPHAMSIINAMPFEVKW